MPIHIMFSSIVDFQIELAKEKRKGCKKLGVCKTSTQNVSRESKTVAVDGDVGVRLKLQPEMVISRRNASRMIVWDWNN